MNEIIKLKHYHKKQILQKNITYNEVTFYSQLNNVFYNAVFHYSVFLETQLIIREIMFSGSIKHIAVCRKCQNIWFEIRDRADFQIKNCTFNTFLPETLLASIDWKKKKFHFEFLK